MATLAIKPSHKAIQAYCLTLGNIPPAVLDYRLGNRSAQEWVIDLREQLQAAPAPDVAGSRFSEGWGGYPGEAVLESKSAIHLCFRVSYFSFRRRHA